MKGWQKSPYFVDVKAGDKLAFCACGKSSKAPMCDGSHKGTEDTPNIMEFDEERSVMICGCLESKKLPLCDGTHGKL